jgi:starch phosphorylase
MVMVKESMRTITPQFSTRRMLKEYIEQLYLPAEK